MFSSIAYAAPVWLWFTGRLPEVGVLTVVLQDKAPWEYGLHEEMQLMRKHEQLRCASTLLPQAGEETNRKCCDTTKHSSVRVT